MYQQQLVIKALAHQIASAGMLTNPLKLDRLISIAAESVTVDKNTDLRTLIMQLKDIPPENIQTATTPWSGLGSEAVGSVVYLNMPAAQELFQAVIDDRTDAWLTAHPQGIPSWNPPE
jgi:anionic cell wall polymer biosynthesis LytR-Cps2A-Psr (LCP) family protein